MSRISIIIPAYNAEQYLKKCLDSVKNQTIEDFECILIDDGSKDNTLLICEEFSQADNRFITISIPNGGVARARNIGLRKVNSPWVTFIDADDFVTPQYLENFLKYNEVDIYTQVIQGYDCLGFEGLDEDTLYPSSHYEYREVDSTKGSEYIEENNLLYNWGIWCKVFSKEIIDKNKIRFEESLKVGEDGLFWHTYLLFIKKLIYVPEIGYTYFCPSNRRSLSRSSSRIPNKKEILPIVKNYQSIFRTLPWKFNLFPKSKILLQNLYINNYFKLLIKYKLEYSEIKELKKFKPQFYDIPITKRGIIFKFINLFPAKFINKLFAN